VDRLAGLHVPEREVRDERGLERRDREYSPSWFEIPAVGVLCPVPRLCESLAHVALAHCLCGAFVVAGEVRGFGVELQDGFAALPGDVGA
jgi:hypothetical protein